MAQATYLEAIRQPLMKASFFALLFCLSASPVGAQESSGPALVPEPDKIVALLRQECAPEIRKIDKVLHLPCHRYEQVTASPVRLERSSSNSVITVYDREALSLVVLKTTRRGWQHVTTRKFTSKYQEPIVSFPSLVEAGIQEISVDQETLIRGTGLLENHQVVYKLFGRELRLVFDQPAHAVLSGWGTATDRGEKSDFRYDAASPKEPGCIYQRTTYTDGAKEFVVFHAYLWDGETKRFRQSPLRDYPAQEWNKLPRLNHQARVAEVSTETNR